MIKTLRITSVIAAILAAGFVAFAVVYGFRSDEDIEKFLNSPSIIDQYRRAGGSKGPKDPQNSPLVVQALAFANYINPPPVRVTAKPEPGPQPPVGPTSPPRPDPPPPPPKFNVVATSFCESRPEMSLVLINEPGKGAHWVREGAKIMHLTIERIKEGAILVNGGDKTYPMAVPAVREVNLLQGASPVSSGYVPSSIIAPGSFQTRPAVDGTRPAGARSAPASSIPAAPIISAEERAWAEKVFAELEASTAAAGDAAPSTAAPEPAPESARITPTEAENLDNLGKELKAVEPSERIRDRYKDRRAERGMSDPRERINQRLEERRKKIEALRREKIRRSQPPEEEKANTD